MTTVHHLKELGTHSEHLFWPVRKFNHTDVYSQIVYTDAAICHKHVFNQFHNSIVTNDEHQRMLHSRCVWCLGVCLGVWCLGVMCVVFRGVVFRGDVYGV